MHQLFKLVIRFKQPSKFQDLSNVGQPTFSVVFRCALLCKRATPLCLPCQVCLSKYILLLTLALALKEQAGHLNVKTCDLQR